MALANQIVKSLTDTLQFELVEAAMLRSLSKQLGVRLQPKSLPLPSGGHLEIDGFSACPGVLCQVRAEAGPLTSDQEQDAMFDVLKLCYAAGVLGNTARRILLFRDRATATQLCSDPGRAEQLGGSGIEVCITAEEC